MWGACYHIMVRGAGGKAIFIAKDNRLQFLHRLGEVGRSCGWRVQQGADHIEVRKYLRSIERMLLCED